MEGQKPGGSLPGYNAKINILKQIDDAASQYGGASQTNKKINDFSSSRNSDAKRTAHLIMSNGKPDGLSGRHLENLNQGYQHGKTLLGAKQGPADRESVKSDLRSMKSEYDYSAKKKFVDVLGQPKKSGLAGLEGLKGHPGMKNMEGASQRSRQSKYSMTSSMRQKMQHMQAQQGADQTINEQPELDLENMVIRDKDGREIHLSEEQMELLETLANQQNNAKLTEKQLGILKMIDFENLKDFEGEQINQILDHSGLEVPYQSKPHDRTNKRMYTFNYHSNSDEYKNLGNLHAEKRVVKYYPQDDKMDFTTRPQIKNEQAEAGRLGGKKDPYHQGSEMRQANRQTDDYNGQVLQDRLSSNPNDQGPFPKTTNQDFHSGEVFDKAQQLNRVMDKQHFRKTNVYAAYVNAMFNSGVFTNPWQDQC